MIKGWTYSNKRNTFSKFVSTLSNDCGFLYAARIDVVQGFSLLKIGATRSPMVRLQNFGKKSSLFCVSPPHINFWENEEKLHAFFEKYRVPARPNNGSRAELFNLSMPYFLDHLPLLDYATTK